MNFFLRLVVFFLNLINFMIKPILWIKSKQIRRAVPVIKNNLLKISATDLAEKIRNRELTSEEVCLAYINRIKEVNPLINAIVQERFESALQDARQVDAYLQYATESKEELEKRKPLFGVPLTVKESCSLAGSSFSVGSLPRSGIKSEQDGEAVWKLKASGAIPLLVSNTPELSLYWECSNFITGRTNNPYDVARSSGGSSGGEGALLGAGASLIGVGTDIAGSIRLPAMFNCVFGHKPSARVIPVGGHFPYVPDKKFADFFAIGPMARYAKDLRIMMKIMACETYLPQLNLDEKVDMSKIRVYFRDDEPFLAPKVQKEFYNVLNQSVTYLKTTFKCKVEENEKFDDLKNALEIGGSVLSTITDFPNPLKSENNNLFVELIKTPFSLSKFTFNLIFFLILRYIFANLVRNDNYLEKNYALKKKFQQELGTDGIFLYPTFGTTAFYHKHFILHCPSVDKLHIFNALGLPSTSVPCGFDEKGLPIGIQVVAGLNQDRLCLAVAEELEKYFGGWIPPN